MKLYRGRLVDHVQLVVRDLEASRTFYEAVLNELRVPIDFEGPGMFSADELAITSASSPGAQGRLTGPTHLAFQAGDKAMVDAFHAAGLAAGGTDNGAPGERSIIPAITRRSCSIRTATISRRSITARPSAARR